MRSLCPGIVGGLFSAAGRQGIFKSFLGWADRAVTEFMAIETELVNAKLGYMGHPDAIVRMWGDSRLTVIDYKTPMAATKTWLPQIAAYAHLAREGGYDIQRGLAVRLRKKGTGPILTQVDIDGEPWAAFLNALGAYRYFKTGR